MTSDTLFGLLLVIVALAVLVTATAAEVAVLFASRLRVRGFASKGVPNAATLDSYVQERQTFMGVLAVGRGVAVVLGIAAGTFLMMRERDSTWATLAVTMAVALAALVLLEAVPRVIVSRSPERWGLRLVPVMRAFQLLFGLPVRGLSALISLVPGGPARREGASGTDEDEEELLRLVQLRDEQGGMENGELAMIRRIAGMGDTAVREIMVPRIDIVAEEADASVDDVLRAVMERGFSRIPIYDETIDDIVGVVHAKDLLQFLADGQRPNSLSEIARPPYFVPEVKHIDELLAELREQRIQLAIVVDEYGGTAGLVTIEDVLEEIVGEIQDEYDREEAAIERLNDAEAIMDARVGLDELNEMFDLQIEGDDYDTVGGFVYHQLGRMPAPGDEVQADGIDLRVISVLGRRIKKIRVTKAPVQAGAAEEKDST
ncbi:MAG: HlyC/CorC family transporter [Chloroflexi bacterium]|nr:HlyC/CorC family transporter [Chloroflexota bacterium]MCI0856887.1 HlyC/CorC family transporter [Chloroflexota bacterium]MCI0889558.1 HlyC/CorC family transporter [Chloroflexota bacterium]